jgi:hypothetical protein
MRIAIREKHWGCWLYLNRQNKGIWTNRKKAINFSRTENQEESMMKYSAEEKIAWLEIQKENRKSI